MLIVDSKSVQNADTAEESGYDGGKCVANVNEVHIQLTPIDGGG
jgi:hypothetical protein